MIGRKKNTNDVIKKVAIGSTIAAGVGYLAGLLTAPKSGKDTRKDIKNVSDRKIAEAEKELKKIYSELDQALEKTKQQGGKLSIKAKKELAELQVAANDTKEKIREMISAIHEGDTQDADLRKAIKQANASIKNLKKYLQK